jgi:hypothetical protein
VRGPELDLHCLIPSPYKTIKKNRQAKTLPLLVLLSAVYLPVPIFLFLNHCKILLSSLYLQLFPIPVQSCSRDLTMMFIFQNKTQPFSTSHLEDPLVFPVTLAPCHPTQLDCLAAAHTFSPCPFSHLLFVPGILFTLPCLLHDFLLKSCALLRNSSKATSWESL